MPPLVDDDAFNEASDNDTVTIFKISLKSNSNVQLRNSYHWI